MPDDPELELLKKLLENYPLDAQRVLGNRVVVSDGYANDPLTVVSEAHPKVFTQSALGFLNQMRSVRGLPRLAVTTHRNGLVTVDYYMPKEVL